MSSPRSTPQPAAQHTPLPWSVSPLDGCTIGMLEPMHGGTPRFRAIAVVFKRAHESPGNAALIVRAVNAHEALAGACEQAIIAMGKLTANFDTRHPCRPAWDACRAALALAEGGRS